MDVMAVEERLGYFLLAEAQILKTMKETRELFEMIEVPILEWSGR